MKLNKILNAISIASMLGVVGFAGKTYYEINNFNNTSMENTIKREAIDEKIGSYSDKAIYSCAIGTFSSLLAAYRSTKFRNPSKKQTRSLDYVLSEQDPLNN